MPQSLIVHVELLTVARRRRYFAVRVPYCAVMLLAMGICYEATIYGGGPI